MSRPASVSPTPATLPIRTVITVSRGRFIAIWWLVQSVHVAFIVYMVNVIKLHGYFIANNLEVTINFMGPTVIGFFSAVITANLVLVICHAASILHSIWWSLHYRQWHFVRKSKAHRQIDTDGHNALTKDRTGRGTKLTSRSPADLAAMPLSRRVLQRSIEALHTSGLALFGRYGIFGVEGTYYERTFFAMEVVEITLQVFQTYKLSYLVPRVWINRLNAVVLILNCWSTAFVHEFLHGDRLAKRVVLLVVDGIFDIVSGMVIPLVIIYPYYQEFDLAWRDFPLVNYYSDVWLIQAISENRQVFVTSWIDFISKLMPGVTVFGGLLVLKQYVVMDRSQHANRGVDSASIVPSSAQTHVPPSEATTGPMERVIKDGDKRILQGKRLSLLSKYMGKWPHLLLFISGLAVLVFHIHSTTVAVLSRTRGCLLEVRPWFATFYTCIALEINCATGEYDGGADLAALEAHAKSIVPSALKSLVFASCSRLHVPPMIQQFTGLQMIKIYNSTVVQWDTTAELREDLHPDLQLLYISDSNISASGDLPVGLLGDKFPPTLVDVEFSGTNLRHLPTKLHDKWTAMQYFVLERNVQITEFPQALLSMKIPQLFLGGNGITMIPDGLLVDQAFWTLNLNGNPLQALPDTIGDLRLLYSVEVADTNVSVLPLWATVGAYDPATGEPILPVLGSADVFASGAPLCEDTQKRETANATKGDWIHLYCYMRTGNHIYPIEDERKWRAASLATMK